MTDEQNLNTSEYWERRYRERSTPWDLGAETNVFRAMRMRGEFPPALREDGTQRRLWIPGCGFGHDALEFAAAGYDVTAVDIATAPLENLQAEAGRRHLPVTCVRADILDVPSHFSEAFDIVLEYTCFCAILPEQRERYVSTVWQTLKPGGLLVGLFFPIVSPFEEGPPFSVPPLEVERCFVAAGFQKTQAYLPAESHPARAGNEIVMIYRKPSFTD